MGLVSNLEAKLVPPPLLDEPGLSDFEVSPDRGRVYDIAVESEDGEQNIPVGVYSPATPGPNRAGTLLRLLPWSMSNSIIYQRSKSQLLADSLGVTVVSPNSVGQGPDTSDLTDFQIEEFYQGISEDAARVLWQAVTRACSSAGVSLDTVDIYAESQGNMFIPGILKTASTTADIGRVLMFNATGFREPDLSEGAGRRHYREILINSMLFMDRYLAANPAGFRELADELTETRFLDQRHAHRDYYPTLTVRGALLGQMVLALEQYKQSKDKTPDIYIVHASEDAISDSPHNASAARNLGAHRHEARGHYHALMEYIPFIAQITKAAFQGENPALFLPPDVAGTDLA